jgi:hypothetical protein
MKNNSEDSDWNPILYTYPPQFRGISPDVKVPEFLKSLGRHDEMSDIERRAEAESWKRWGAAWGNTESGAHCFGFAAGVAWQKAQVEAADHCNDATVDSGENRLGPAASPEG